MSLYVLNLEIHCCSYISSRIHRTYLHTLIHVYVCAYIYFYLHTHMHTPLHPFAFHYGLEPFLFNVAKGLGTTVCLIKAPGTVFMNKKKKKRVLSENLTINFEINISLALTRSIDCNTSVFSCVTDLSVSQCQDSAPRQNLQYKHDTFSTHSSM